MDERQREHLIQQLEHETELAKQAISRAIQTENRGIARRGITRSSIHTQAIAEVVHEHVVAFVNTCFERAFSIANGLEAHGIAQKFASEFADSWIPKTDDIAWPGVSVLRGQVEMGVRIMHQSADSLRQEIARMYELEAFRFENAGREAQLAENVIPAAKPNKSGRPPAEWWDDMWVAIAKQLYEGKLVPKRQVDIEDAMHEWIAAKDSSASTSTVRKRARKLWDALKMEDEN
jgi:hypothetical protein